MRLWRFIYFSRLSPRLAGRASLTRAFCPSLFRSPPRAPGLRRLAHVYVDLLPISSSLISAHTQVQATVDEDLTWVPVATVFATVSYLCLEVLLTKQVSNAVFTEVCAICTLDALSRPWDCASSKWRVSESPPGVPRL